MNRLNTITSVRQRGRVRRHLRIRKRVSGTKERPRVTLGRSHLHLSAQAIDDASQKTLVSLTTASATLRKKITKGGNVEAAGQLGAFFAEAAQKKGIKRIVFDRSGYLYHGRVKAFAESARKSGLEF